MFVGTWAMAGGKKSPATQSPPINAASKDEENFIQYVNNEETFLTSSGFG